MAGLFVKLDTSFWEHPKVLAAGERAAVLYLQMLCYSKANLTDGFVPDAMLPRFGLSGWKARATALAAHDLIDWAEGGYRIVGWDERNRTRAEVEDIRAKRREAGGRGGLASGRARSKVLHDVEANGKQIASTLSNPEYRVQSSEFREPTPSPPPPDQSRPAADAAAAAAAPLDLPTELLRLAGYPTTQPTAGERSTVEGCLARDLAPDDLRAIAARASLGDINPRALLLKLLTEALNDPASFRASTPAPPGHAASPGETRDTAWAAVAAIASRDGASTLWLDRLDLSPRTRAAAHEARLAIRNQPAKDAKWVFFEAYAAAEPVPA